MRAADRQAAVCAAEPPAPAAEAFAKGQEHLGHRTAGDLRAATQDFERAIAADATFAPAWAGLAEARALLFDYRGAREAALRGLALDEHLAAAHAVLGFVRLHGDWDWAGAETASGGPWSSIPSGRRRTSGTRSSWR